MLDLYSSNMTLGKDSENRSSMDPGAVGTAVFIYIYKENYVAPK